MAVDWEAVAAAGAAVAVAGLSVVREWTARQGVRTRIKDDLALLKDLPSDSTMRDQLRKHVDERIGALMMSEQETRRDPNGIGLAVFFTIVTIWLFAVAVDDGGLWWLGVFGVGLFAFAGLGASLPKVRRDERGRRIKETVPGDP